MVPKTLLVTRPKGDEQQITEALQELGHFVIHEPLTEIFLNHTLRGMLASQLHNDPDAILITSRHAVQSLALLTDIRDIFLLCVGEATTEHAISLGFSRVECGGKNIESLLETITGGYDEDARFLYISGAHIHSDLPVILESYGMQCERVVTYEAIASESLSDTLIEQIKRGQIDAITLFSARNAEILCHLLDDAGISEASTVLDIFCLSDEVANAATALDWANIYIAAEPTLASMVERVDNVYH